ncbi:hypothetical protein DERP_000021 [Dermatophagoides pteronyssinus]|uniref:Uncharacterized protein n=1 Tax=Dermatophagoides pteronyssinus TaxID=6956 RepID=A0ABQ8IYZ4_DERPT|nr:hypothetical protein DERP_000021 [Dermatophagoides pteronyssinus]
MNYFTIILNVFHFITSRDCVHHYFIGDYNKIDKLSQSLLVTDSHNTNAFLSLLLSRSKQLKFKIMKNAEAKKKTNENRNN